LNPAARLGIRNTFVYMYDNMNTLILRVIPNINFFFLLAVLNGYGHHTWDIVAKWGPEAIAFEFKV
jgi:hypothetical protein